jgi:hypothetical protein
VKAAKKNDKASHVIINFKPLEDPFLHMHGSLHVNLCDLTSRRQVDGPEACNVSFLGITDVPQLKGPKILILQRAPNNDS